MCHVLFACLSLLCCEGADSRDVNTQSRRYLNNVPTARQYICRYSSQISADKYSFRVLFTDINASVCVKALILLLALFQHSICGEKNG